MMAKRFFWQLPIILVLVLAIGAAAQTLEQELAELKAKLAQLDSGLAAARSEVRSLGKRPNVYGEFRGTVNFAGNNSVTHNVFNAARLAYSPDSDSRTVVMLYLQNGLGGTTVDDNAGIQVAEFFLHTRLSLNERPYNLTLGNFFYSATPFTIQRAYYAKDINIDRRQNFNGILVDGRLFEMPYVGMLSPLRSGEGIGFDRFLHFHRVQTRLKSAGLTLSYLQVADDPKSAVSPSRAYRSSILSSQLNYDGMLLGYWVSVESELCLSRNDNDLLRGSEAKKGSAFRLSASTSDLRIKRTRIPLNLSVYRITKEYPMDYNTIRRLPVDYLYQEEENPRISDYFVNVANLKLRVGPVRQMVGRYPTSTNVNMNYAREVEPDSQERKAFGYLGLSSNIELDPKSSVEVACGQYLTTEGPSFRFAQTIFDGKVNRNFNQMVVGLGYKVIDNQQRDLGLRSDVISWEPYVELKLRTGYGNLEAKLVNKRITRQGRSIGGWKHELKYTGRIAAAMNLRLDYTEEAAGSSPSRNLYFSYQIVF